MIEVQLWCGPEVPTGDGLSCGDWADEHMTEVLPYAFMFF